MKNTTKSLITAACLYLLGMAALSSPAFALTPDGVTPANEGVCDVLRTDGVTKGLYGLCVAYCEAQDLDTVDKEPPSSKILDNYNRKKQAGDPDMPCLQVPCPCWSDEELASFTADGLIAACIGGDSEDKVQIIDNATLTKLADADISTGRERCRYVDLNTSPRTIRSFSITPDEALTCFTALVNACNSVLP